MRTAVVMGLVPFAVVGFVVVTEILANAIVYWWKLREEREWRAKRLGG